MTAHSASPAEQFDALYTLGGAHIYASSGATEPFMFVHNDRVYIARYDGEECDCCASDGNTHETWCASREGMVISLPLTLLKALCAVLEQEATDE